MSTNVKDSFYVYLNSIGNILEHPNNTVSNFTNIIKPDIILNDKYSVGLENIFFQEKFYTVTKDDELFEIKIRVLYYNKGIFRGGESVIYKPRVNLSFKHIEHIIKSVDNDLRAFLHEQRVINATHGPLIEYPILPSTGYVVFNKLIPLNITNYTYDKVLVKWSFGSMIAHVLGVSERSTFTPVANMYASLPMTINNIFVYSDIIELSRMGDQQVNILDIIPVGDTFSKNTSNVIYKTVKDQRISSISISLRDKFDRNIPFLDGNNVTLVLHFKRE